jgi:hypothetical protein
MPPKIGHQKGMGPEGVTEFEKHDFRYPMTLQLITICLLKPIINIPIFLFPSPSSDILPKANLSLLGEN